MVGDVTSERSNADAVAAALTRFGRLDTAVFNAGIPMSGDLLDLPMEEFDRTIAVNVRAVVLGIRSVVPQMRLAGAGRIIVTASTSGIGGDPNMWAYNASKGAVINLVRATAVDLGPDNITVNAVCPGPTETGMTAQSRAMPERHEQLRRTIPLQRWGRADGDRCRDRIPGVGRRVVRQRGGHPRRWRHHRQHRSVPAPQHAGIDRSEFANGRSVCQSVSACHRACSICSTSPVESPSSPVPARESVAQSRGRLADAGCDVVINARRLDDLEATAAGVESRGRSALIVAGDIRDLSEELADRAMERFGRIDVWVNNVGGSDEKTTRALVDTPDEVFRAQLELNLTSAFQGCKAAAKRMKPGSSIVNISSGAGTRGSPFTGPYAAAKAGMNNLSETLALELAPNIRVNTVAPGPVATEAFDEVLNTAGQLEAIAATIPLGRMGTPNDIAGAVLYLASDAASWVTGQLILVAGGRTHRVHQYQPRTD